MAARRAATRIAILAWAAAAVARAGAPDASALRHAADYAFAYYPDGFRGRDANGDTILAFQTNRYGAWLNASRARLERLWPIASPKPAEEAVAEGADVVASLPDVRLEFSIEIGGETWRADRAAPQPDRVILQRGGRYLQQWEIREVSLRNAKGEPLAGAEARIEIFAWSDRLSAILRARLAEGRAPISGATLVAGLELSEDCAIHELSENRVWHEAAPGANSARAMAAVRGDGQGLALINSEPTGSYLLRAAPRRIEWRSEKLDLRAGAESSLAAIVAPAASDPLIAGFEEFLDTQTPLTSSAIGAEGLKPYRGALPVEYDPARGWYQVKLGENSDIWTSETARLRLENPYAEPRTIRLNFAKLGGSFGITGMAPLLLGEEGRPIPLPMQLSKNWHCRPPWFSGLAELHLDPGARVECDFALAYARWGRLPTVSHAQLCLEGYGGNQQWDEMAIGSFGESVCYDPEVNLTRSMIDDMRPLMVWAMGPQPRRQWSWTNNVGGGDFLVLETRAQGEAAPKRWPIYRQKTLYSSQGPELADVTYCGEARGGAIRSRIRARSWQCADFVRALYTIRYDVVREAEGVSRLAFFQLGADRYNESIVGAVARGADGDESAPEIWEPARGGEDYSRRGEPLPGKRPWIALYGCRKPKSVAAGDQGAWADRGCVLLDWNARLGGREGAEPRYSIRATGQGDLANALVELSPPPDLHRLEPGDRVEAEIEMLIFPQRRDDYYGDFGMGADPAFGEALKKTPPGEEWRLVSTEAREPRLHPSIRLGAR